MIELLIIGRGVFELLWLLPAYSESGEVLGVSIAPTVLTTAAIA